MNKRRLSFTNKNFFLLTYDKDNIFNLFQEAEYPTVAGDDMELSPQQANFDINDSSSHESYDIDSQRLQFGMNCCDRDECDDCTNNSEFLFNVILNINISISACLMKLLFLVSI